MSTPQYSKEMLQNVLIANGITPANTIPQMTAQLHAATTAARNKRIRPARSQELSWLQSTTR